MNRNERRAREKAAEKAAAKPGATPRPSAAAQTKAEKLKAEGMALKNAGKEAEAVPLLIKALSLDSSFADAHFALAIMSKTKPALNVDINQVNEVIRDKKLFKLAYQGILAVLKKRKQFEEALVCQQEVCRLFPDDLVEQADLALMLNLLDQKEEALRIMAELMNKDPSSKIFKGVFNGLMGHVNFGQNEPLIKKALESCFENIYECNLSKAYSVWISTVINDPDCGGTNHLPNLVTVENPDNFLNQLDPEKISFVRNPFFLDGLRLLIIGDPILEIFLVRMKHFLVTHAEALAKDKKLDFYEPFLFALGEQSFLNEYLYPQRDEEKVYIQSLIEKIRKNEDTGLSERQAYAYVSCFYPLYKVFPDKESVLASLSKTSPGFAKLFKTQFLDPLEEEKLKKTLKHFGTLENQVSKNVQDQYEENPYPRWVSVVNFATPNDSIPMPEEQRLNPWKILIAGCGTGRHALGTTAMYPNAKVTAIDLSRASLAYAQRKANESGLSNRVSFIHADILSMKDWPEQFDIIESSGVLHHMEDPFEGWQILTDRLKTGGYFKIGLYSEVARKQVVEARNYIEENGFESTADGIRACRESIINMPPSHPMRQRLVSTTDFYASSVVRDLIFHVQEHRMTLPQIQSMMDKLGLVCTEFVMTDSNALRKYDKMYPQDIGRSNLSNWHDFETKYPDTFLGMYQFWCMKVK